MPAKPKSKFVIQQKGRFMPPAAFKVGKGIPQPTGGSPMMKRGGTKKLVGGGGSTLKRGGKKKLK